MDRMTRSQTIMALQTLRKRAGALAQQLDWLVQRFEETWPDDMHTEMGDVLHFLVERIQRPVEKMMKKIHKKGA